MFKPHNAREARLKRHHRIRARLAGTLERPRLAIFRSAKHIYAQVIDDRSGHTIAAASTLEAAAREQIAEKPKKGAAEVVGALVARRAQEAGISQVVFDRGGYLYHGRVAALAQAARDAGLKF